ncbi:hypothetical protein PFISCL1PPCAC_3223, partial [Pristionchus fissidentatus]
MIGCVVPAVTAVNDFTKERQFRGMQVVDVTIPQVSVVRGGQSIEIPSNELVTGDVALVEHGDVIPADGVLIHSGDLTIDESSITGASGQISKTPEYDPIVLSGSRIIKGSGKMLVCAVGVHSQQGFIAAQMCADNLAGSEEAEKIPMRNGDNDTKIDDETGQPLIGTASHLVTDGRTIHKRAEHANGNGTPPKTTSEKKQQSLLQTKINRLAIQIGYAGLLAGALTTAILFYRFYRHHYVIEERPFSFADLQYFINFFIIGTMVIVMAMPQGLPLVLTLALAYSVKKMRDGNMLVRRLDVCEKMGDATSICVDKTGTLTTNTMTVDTIRPEVPEAIGRCQRAGITVR